MHMTFVFPNLGDARTSATTISRHCIAHDWQKVFDQIPIKRNAHPAGLYPSVQILLQAPLDKHSDKQSYTQNGFTLVSFTCGVGWAAFSTKHLLVQNLDPKCQRYDLSNCDAGPGRNRPGPADPWARILLFNKLGCFCQIVNCVYLCKTTSKYDTIFDLGVTIDMSVSFGGPYFLMMFWS